MNFLVITLLFAICAGQLIKFPLDFGGITFLDLSVTCLSAYGLFKIKMHSLKLPNVYKFSLIFVAIGCVSLFFTPLHLAPDEYIISFSYTLRLFVYFLFGFVIYAGGLPEIKKNIFKILLYSGAMLSILGLVQFILLPDLQPLAIYGWDPHYFREVSTFLDPNFLGAYFVLTLILIIGDSTKHIPSKKIKIVFGILYLGLLLTFSRSSYLMYFISLLVIGFFSKRNFKFGLFAITSSLVLALGFLVYSQVIASPRNIDRTKSAEFRVNAWQQGISIFSRSPLLGVGFNSYRYAIREFDLAPEQFIESHGASTNDSSLLYVASTTGVLGLIAYISLIISALVYSFRKNIFLFSALLGLLVHSLFANSLFYPFIIVWILLFSNYSFLSSSGSTRGSI